MIIMLNSAFNLVEVEVEAELGKNVHIVLTHSREDHILQDISIHCIPHHPASSVQNVQEYFQEKTSSILINVNLLNLFQEAMIWMKMLTWKIQNKKMKKM